MFNREENIQLTEHFERCNDGGKGGNGFTNIYYIYI